MWERELTGKLKQIRRRMRLLSFYQVFFTYLFFAACGLILFAIASKVVLIDLPTIWEVIAYLGIGGFAVCGLWALLYPQGLFQTAIQADISLDLKERLSTAYIFIQDEREIVEEVKKDALSSARRINTTRDFKPLLPRHTKFFWLPAIIAFVLWQFLPPLDLFARRSKESENLAATSAANKAVSEELEKISKTLEKAPTEQAKKEDMENLKEIKKDIEELAKQIQLTTAKPQQTLAKISNIEEKLEESRKKMQEKLDASQMMKPLQKSGTAQEMAKAMKQGDYKKAQEKLNELSKKLESGEMSKQEMERLADDLAQMSSEMKDNPEMSKALEAMANKLKGCKDGKCTAKDLSDLKKLSSQLDKEMLNMKELEEQLKNMAEMEKKLGECKGKCCGKGNAALLGNGKSDRDKIGPGQGGEGIGKGNPAPFSKNNEAKFQDEKIDGKQNDGSIIASMKDNKVGEGEVGGSQLKSKETIMEYKQESEETMDKEQIPAGYRDMVRDYFDQIAPPENRANSKTEEVAPAPKTETKDNNSNNK